MKAIAGVKVEDDGGWNEGEDERRELFQDTCLRKSDQDLLCQMWKIMGGNQENKSDSKVLVYTAR